MTINTLQKFGFTIVLASFAGCGSGSDNAGLSRADSVAVAKVQADYVAAWLADDTAGVLATFDSQAVLLPPGLRPVEGRKAILDHWWPQDGSRTHITAFTLDAAELVGSGRLAYARGLSTVSWTYAKDTARSAQTVRNISLSIFRRGGDGKWRIARQMWGPALTDPK